MEITIEANELDRKFMLDYVMGVGVLFTSVVVFILGAGWDKFAGWMLLRHQADYGAGQIILMGVSGLTALLSYAYIRMTYHYQKHYGK